MEITKEYLDKQFKVNLKLTKEYLDKSLDEKLDKKLDEKLKNMVTKDDLQDALKAQTIELKGYVHESFETQQVYLDERFKELVAGMEVKVNFPALKTRHI